VFSSLALSQELVESLFQRFNYEDNDSVDIYDFLISLAVLARMQNDNKLDLIFKLMDVDEDNCLSVQDVFKMIFTIEKNFVKEINY
jgi:Ca2+-binding EF-hand superfamily protein